MECLQTRSILTGSDLLPILRERDRISERIERLKLSFQQELTQTARDSKFRSVLNLTDLEFLDDTDSDQWFEFCLQNLSDVTHNLVVRVGPSTLSEIDFYPQKANLPFFRTGSVRNTETRDIPIAGFAFKVSLAPKEQQAFYLRINATDNPFYRRTNIDENPFYQVTLWDRDSFDVDNNRTENLFGIIIGVFLALAVYHLLLFFLARQWTSVLYIAVIFCIFIVLMSLNGRLGPFLPPSHPEFSNLAIAIFYPLSLLFASFFFKAFIKLKNYPKLNTVSNVLIGASVILLVATFKYRQANYVQACDLVAIFVASYFGVCVPVYAYVKDRLVAAKYMLITLVPLVFCLVDRALFGFGVTDQYYVPYKIVTAAMFTMLVISYYMGLIAYREKQAAQNAALEQLNISNTLKSNYNSQLEAELEQKTTDIRLMNVDLEQKANKLQQLDESKSRFFANISHEFRTPLTLIEGPLTSLLERENFAEKDIISGVVRHSNSLKGLIDQILLLSELDENSLDVKASKVNLVQTLKGVVSQFDSVYQHKGVALACIACQPDIQVYADVEKLQVIINNLLSNAIKFTQATGQVTVEISTTVDAAIKDEYTSDEYVHITVSDTGQGIPASELNHVFDRYFQSETSELSKSGIGTGIGLALVKELVELHAGEVSVESRYESEQGVEDSGTTFRIILPLGRAHLRDHEIVDSSPTSSAQHPLIPESIGDEQNTQESSQQGARATTVLVVDDNQDMRQHIRRLLEAEHNIITAADGLLAETVLKQQRPDLIITDLMMPNRNGLEFVQSIKKQGGFANIPIIMLTARAGMHDRIKGLMAAVDDYLVKPFNGRELKARIQNLLNKQAQFEVFYQHTPASPLSNRDAIAVKNSRAVDRVDNAHNEAELNYLQKVKDLVNKRLMEPEFGVEDLAKALHVSEATLRRRLSKQADFTPAAFIRHCRLEKARQLAEQGNMRTIAELAQAVGFSKPSYFARLYEKTFNCELQLNVSSTRE